MIKTGFRSAVLENVMLTVKEYICAAGLSYDHNDIKLVKHVDHGDRSIRDIIERGYFDFYQAEQVSAKKPFHDCEVIISFIGMGNNLAELVGVYKVTGSRPYTRKDAARAPDIPGLNSVVNRAGEAKIWYDLEELPEYRELCGRVVVQWKSTRGWVQKKDLEIFEIQPPNSTAPFPGYQDIFISHEQLAKIVENPRAHRDWKAALSANAGIYRIVDMSTGEIYIGSAYGIEGIWGRWAQYARNGHGGNKLLKDRESANFRWSVVRTLSRAMSEKDVVHIEAREKIKHGSRAHGLNSN